MFLTLQPDLAAFLYQLEQINLARFNARLQIIYSSFKFLPRIPAVISPKLKSEKVQTRNSRHKQITESDFADRGK